MKYTVEATLSNGRSIKVRVEARHEFMAVDKMADWCLRRYAVSPASVHRVKKIA